jgi:hypothetical protein
MRIFILCLVVCFFCARIPVTALAQEIPANARLYLPILLQEIDTHWPDVSLRSVLGAQVEQETCASLTSRRCWNPSTELKTSREYGFGLGQITVTKRFDTFSEVKRLDPTLKAWKWADRYDPVLQLRALVLKDRYNVERFPLASTPLDSLRFGIAAYNGGLGGMIKDINLCRSTPGCDPGRWEGHVEKTSLKSRKKWKGYGQSAYEINRGYVRNIFGPRREKYIVPMDTPLLSHEAQKTP